MNPIAFWWRTLHEALTHAPREHGQLLVTTPYSVQPPSTRAAVLHGIGCVTDFYAFDALSIQGEDRTALPLIERKRR